MNERDTEQVSQMFTERGYTMTGTDLDADVVLINTCSVRDQAEQKALGKMGMVRRRKVPLVTGFMGCMAQSRGSELVDKAKVDLVVGTQKYHRVVEYVDEIIRAKEAKQMDEERFSIVDVDEEEASQNTIRDHTLKEKQASAFVSIMQGCNMKCTFCIVPYTRGGERGRPIADIVEEVRPWAQRLVARRFGPERVSADALRAMQHAHVAFRDLPTQASQLLVDLERGRIAVTARDPDAEALRLTVSHAASALTWGVVFAATLMCATALLVAWALAARQVDVLHRASWIAGGGVSMTVLLWTVSRLRQRSVRSTSWRRRLLAVLRFFRPPSS
jgi:hypothetical protein